MKKKVQVIMLPTDKTSNIKLIPKGEFDRDNNLGKSKYTDSDKLWFFKESSEYGYQSQFLYIISDEEIKEEDITINTFNNSNSIFKITKVFTDGYEGQKLDDKYCQYGLQKTLKKIIATTNSELWNFNPQFLKGWNTIGKIPTDFIEHYIHSYNKSNIIKEVYVEYENRHDFAPKSHHIIFQIPKLSSDGCVIISNIEERVYTREEVLAIAFNAYNLRTVDKYVRSTEGLKEWFDKNYPK